MVLTHNFIINCREVLMWEGFGYKGYARRDMCPSITLYQHLYYYHYCHRHKCRWPAVTYERPVSLCVKCTKSELDMSRTYLKWAVVGVKRRVVCLRRPSQGPVSCHSKRCRKGRNKGGGVGDFEKQFAQLRRPSYRARLVFDPSTLKCRLYVTIECFVYV